MVHMQEPLASGKTPYISSKHCDTHTHARTRTHTHDNKDKNPSWHACPQYSKNSHESDTLFIPSWLHFTHIHCTCMQLSFGYKFYSHLWSNLHFESNTTEILATQNQEYLPPTPIIINALEKTKSALHSWYNTTIWGVIETPSILANVYMHTKTKD